MQIVTWNMQGIGGTKFLEKLKMLDYLFKSGFDVICLQEATSSLGSFENCINGPDNILIFSQNHSNKTRRQPVHNYFCFYYEWKKKNGRCSLAIYTKLLVQECGLINPPPSCGNSRPLLWIRHLYTYIGTVHLPSGKPGLAWKCFDSFNQAMCSKALPAERYVIAGDFNMPPEFINENDKEGGNYYTIGPCTQKSGQILDYIYCKGKVVDVREVKSTQGEWISDHKCIRGSIF